MSNNLGAPTLAVNQLAKETTINDAVGRIDAGMTERLALTLTAGSGTYAPTTSQLQQAVFIELIPDGTTPPLSTDKPILQVKSDLKRFYVISNTCACAVAVQRHSNNVGEVVVPAGSTVLIVNKDPTTSNQLVQVSDGFTSDVKRPVRLAWGSNVVIATALNNGDTLDGLTLSTGDRVLLYGQTTASENGIYVVGVSPVRSNDSSFTGSLNPSTIVPVLAGSDLGKIFYCSNTSVPIIGTTSITFVSLTATSPYIAGLYFPGTPTASSCIWRHITTDVKFFLTDNFSGSVGHVGTNPSATTDFDVRRNNTSIGTISISTGGVVTFSTSGSTNENFISTERLEVFAPAILNGVADISITFRGTRN